jgi:hypothetical protein
LYAGNSTTARKKVPKMARIEMQALNAPPLILGDAMLGHSASAGDVENAYAGSATNIPAGTQAVMIFCTACIGHYFIEKCSQSEDALKYLIVLLSR